ncbi:hypothetical protein NQZ68_020341 [Dissostichus eleginoides]|nr:hypothetical protein NQZ68_020341 [Dissostichus eleginoides]
MNAPLSETQDILLKEVISTVPVEDSEIGFGSPSVECLQSKHARLLTFKILLELAQPVLSSDEKVLCVAFWGAAYKYSTLLLCYFTQCQGFCKGVYVLIITAKDFPQLSAKSVCWRKLQKRKIDLRILQTNKPIVQGLLVAIKECEDQWEYHEVGFGAHCQTPLNGLPSRKQSVAVTKGLVGTGPVMIDLQWISEDVSENWAAELSALQWCVKVFSDHNAWSVDVCLLVMGSKFLQARALPQTCLFRVGAVTLGGESWLLPTPKCIFFPIPAVGRVAGPYKGACTRSAEGSTSSIYVTVEMKSQACQPGSWTERDQAIDFRANPISPQPAALRTEIIPMGYEKLGESEQCSLLEPRTDRPGKDSSFLRTMVLDKEEGVPMLSVQPKGKQKGCAGCNRKIKDRYLLKALDKYWHEDCLKCACCDCRLGEVGSTLYTKANLILCRRDYLRLFGTTGNCAACSKLIPAFEMVMRARDNVYHLDCFACQLCNQRFCVGDKFFLKNNMILCQMDYEEGQLNGSFDTQVQ